jgi:hypothetical protein
MAIAAYVAPDRLSDPARAAIERTDLSRDLACCDISLWEIAMLAGGAASILVPISAAFSI